jgi:hypothetical protein
MYQIDKWKIDTELENMITKGVLCVEWIAIALYLLQTVPANSIFFSYDIFEKKQEDALFPIPITFLLLASLLIKDLKR